MDVEKSNKGPNLFRYKGQSWSSLTNFFNEVSGKCNPEILTVDTDKNINRLTEIKMEMPSSLSEPRELLEFTRQPWSTWIKSTYKNLNSNDISKKDVPVTDCRVTRLPYEDMGLYGTCPLNEQFSAVICDTCGAVVKAQGLKRHIEIKHPGGIQNFLPPKQLSVKKSRPNILSKKCIKELVTTTPVSCTPTSLDNTSNSTTNTTPALQPVVSLKPIESTPITSGVKASVQLSPCKPPVTTVQSEPEVANSSNIQRRKSPNLDRKRPRERDTYDDKLATDTSSSSARTTPLKSTLNPQKRPHTTPTTPMVVFHQLTGASNNNSNTSSSSNNNINNSSNSKQFVTSTSRKLVDSYQRKPCTKITIWERSEADIHHKDNTSFNIVGLNNNATLPSVTTQRTKEYDNAERTTVDAMTSTSNDWPNVNVAQMLMGNEMNVTLLPSLVPSETPEPLPESSSTPQVLTERPPPEPEPPCTPPRTTPSITPVMQSPNIPSIDPPILDADQLINSVNPFRILPITTDTRKGNSVNTSPAKAVPFNKDHITPLLNLDDHFTVNKYKNVQSRSKVSTSKSTDTESASHQVIQVIPPSASPYSVKVNSSNGLVSMRNGVLILSSKEPALPAVNLNVNTESTEKTVLRNQYIKSSNPASILKPRAVKVPVTVQMPLQEKVTNITFYKNSPKPIAVSNFSGKKVGGALIFNNKKLNAMRSDFKTVISKKGMPRNISTVTLKACPSGATMYTARPIGVSSYCRFAKSISVIPHINPNIAHRPNILRGTNVISTRALGHIPKILATSLKRSATSSPQIANIADCKHLLLTSGTALNGYINKYIVHNRAGHEVNESGEGASASHITVEKVVPVNIK